MKTPVTDSTEDTRDNLISAVMGALQERTALYVQVAWKRVGGGVVHTNCITVPGFTEGQPYAMHFFS